jgi:hypothetical protein
MHCRVLKQVPIVRSERDEQSHPTYDSDWLWTAVVRVSWSWFSPNVLHDE